MAKKGHYVFRMCYIWIKQPKEDLILKGWSGVFHRCRVKTVDQCFQYDNLLLRLFTKARYEPKDAGPWLPEISLQHSYGTREYA